MRSSSSRRAAQLYRKDGAVWFRASQFGDDEDRVLVRANGQKTYFAPDIAYHLQKRERGFARLIDVLGADHHGYVARVRGALVAMGEPGDSLEACLMQFVSLFRGGQKIPMGKREAQFVTLRQLREEVGNDACRLFYLMRSHDQHARLRSRAGQVAHQRQPGLLHPVRARARRERDEAARGARNSQYDAAMALGASRRGSTVRTSRRCCASCARYPEVVLQAAARARAARAGALPARAREQLPHLVQRRDLHRR